jgi:hypothetical protein
LNPDATPTVMDDASATDEVRSLRYVVVALAGSATLLKLLIAANTFGTNDVHYWMEFAQGVRSFGPVGIYGHSFFAQYNHPPLAGWMLWAVNGLTGHHVASFTFLIRAPASIADLFTGVLVFDLVRLRRSARVAAASAVLVTWSPVLFVVSGFHGNTDPVFVMLTLLSIDLLVDRRRPFAAGVSLALALSVKLVPVVIGPVVLFVLVRQGSRRLGMFAAGFAVPMTILWGPVVATRWSEFEQNVLSYQGIWLRQWGLVQFSEWLNGPTDFFVGPGRWLPLILSAGLPALLLWRYPDRPEVAAGLGLVLFLLLSPAFGMQYLAWPLAASYLVSVRFGTLYNLAASAFVVVVYDHWNGDHLPWDWHEAVGQPFDHREFVLMVVTWVSLALVAASALRQQARRRK